MEEGQKAEVDAKGGLKIEPTEEDQPEAVGCEGVQSLSDIQVPKTGQLCELDSKSGEEGNGEGEERQGGVENPAVGHQGQRKAGNAQFHL